MFIELLNNVDDPAFLSYRGCRLRHPVARVAPPAPLSVRPPTRSTAPCRHRSPGRYPGQANRPGFARHVTLSTGSEDEISNRPLSRKAVRCLDTSDSVLGRASVQGACTIAHSRSRWHVRSAPVHRLSAGDPLATHPTRGQLLDCPHQLSVPAIGREAAERVGLGVSRPAAG